MVPFRDKEYYYYIPRQEYTCNHFNHCLTLTSGGSKGGEGRTPPPSGPKFLHFHAFFGKNWPNNRLAPPPLLAWRPLLWEILDPPLLTISGKPDVSKGNWHVSTILFEITSLKLCIDKEFMHLWNWSHYLQMKSPNNFLLSQVFSKTCLVHLWNSRYVDVRIFINFNFKKVMLYRSFADLWNLSCNMPKKKR